MSKISPKIIVRMVASDSEKTIARAVESVLNQTYANWELHVIIRGSTDSTAEIVRGYSESDPRVRVLINKDNWIFEPGNDILDYYTDYDVARDYVCFMDGDDEYKPRFMEDMLAFAEENELDIAACGNDILDVATGIVRPFRKLDEKLIITGDDFGGLFTVYHQFMRTRWAKLFRLSVTDKLDRSRIFWLYYCDDTVEVLEYFRNAARVGIYPETYYIWYQDSSSVSYRWDSRRIEADRILFDLTVSYLMDKVGYVTKDNYDFLYPVYFNALAGTVDVLIKAEVPLPEVTASVHDIVTCHHTRRAAEFTATTYKCTPSRKAEMLKTVRDWLAANKSRIDTEIDAGTASEPDSALELLGMSKPPATAVALWTVQNENARSVLEISGFDGRFPEAVREVRGETKIDRIDLTDGGGNPWKYDTVHGSEALGGIAALPRYDVIVVFHLFENTERDAAREILEALLMITEKQVLVLTPEYPYDLEADGEKLSTVRAYDPMFFLDMDFSYKMLDTREGNMQAYSFFSRDDDETEAVSAEFETDAGDDDALLEYGAPPLFGDYGRLISSGSEERRLLRERYRAAGKVLAANEAVKTALRKFGVDARVCRPRIDTEIYRPLPKKNDPVRAGGKQVPTVLIVQNMLHGIEPMSFAIAALFEAHKLGVKFTAQVALRYGHNVLPNLPFAVERFIEPDEKQLAGLYRNADVFLSCSFHELFSREPLLAMASGTAVIAGDSVGVSSYAEPGVNCILFEQENVASLIMAIKFLLENPQVRGQLGEAGRETALLYKWHPPETLKSEAER